MEPLTPGWGDHIRNLRDDVGSVRELAEILDVHPSTVYRWMDRDTSPIGRSHVEAEERVTESRPDVELERFVEGFLERPTLTDALGHPVFAEDMNEWLELEGDMLEAAFNSLEGVTIELMNSDGERVVLDSFDFDGYDDFLSGFWDAFDALGGSDGGVTAS